MTIPLLLVQILDIQWCLTGSGIKKESSSSSGWFQLRYPKTLSQEACLPLYLVSCNAHSPKIFVLIYRGKITAAETKRRGIRAEFPAYKTLKTNQH